MTGLPETPPFGLEGRRALVTGAGRGIGRAAAVALARAGARTTLVARSKDGIARLAAELGEAGCSADHKALDVTQTQEVRDWIAGQEPFQVLVNNAGTARHNPVTGTPDEDFDAVMGLNVKAAWVLASCCAAALIKGGLGGSIINMSSQMGHVSWKGRALYSATKFAVEGFTRGMALEWAPHGIRVNTVCPTFVRTEMTAPMLADEQFRQEVEQRIPLGRVGEVEDLMGPVLFLASDASALVTGSSLMVDGGWTAA